MNSLGQVLEKGLLHTLKNTSRIKFQIQRWKDYFTKSAHATYPDKYGGFFWASWKKQEVAAATQEVAAEMQEEPVSVLHV